MGDKVQLNKAQFNARLKLVLDSWTSADGDSDYSSISEVDALFAPSGESAGEDEPIRKGSAFQTWLFGFEFPSTLFLFQKDKVYILCSASKAKYLSQIQTPSSPVPIEIFVMPKAKDPPNDSLNKFLERYIAHGRVGTFLKEQQRGKFIDEWNRALDSANKKPEVVDMGPAVSAFMAVKDEEEMKLVRTAANLTSTLLAHHVATKLEMILDREAKVSHEAFARQIESRLGSGEGEAAKGPDMKVWDKGKGLNNIDWMSTEFCYTPIIQSRSSSSGYDLRFSAESTEDDLAHKGVLLVSLGMRYKGYCANLGRSFIVDPTKEQEAIYNLLLALQGELLIKIKNGVVIRDIYQHALNYVKKEKPELEGNFVKSIGFGMGLEFRDSAYLLSAKNGRKLRTGMILNLSLGFQDLEEAGGKKYALQLADTVRVDDSRATLFTAGVSGTRDTMFYINQEEEKKPQKPAKAAPSKALVNGSPMKNKTAGGKVLRNKTRSAAQEEVLQSTAAKIHEHQRELHAALQSEGLAKYSEEGDGAGKNEAKSWKRFQSYKGEAGLPREVENLRIFVDRKMASVIVPINGFAVPFHINAIKNASKNEEGEYTLLRINFQTPGQLAGKKEDTPFEDPDATFIRSVTYRSTDGHRFDNIAKQITELKKEINKREAQKKQLADVIEQGSLVEVKGRRPHKLPEVFIRPALDGKRLPGEVEIHQNGLRYVSPGHQKVDILFSNIKHLFFQPCDNELLVIFHCHLKSPIMIGKRKAHDVQFFREASDVQFDETGNRKRKYRYGDEDEIEMEQQERKRRQMLNKEFKHFSEKVAEAATQSTGDTVEIDIPFRELSFEGVPHRTNVRLMPTTECLVHLSDAPFLVVTLSDIEIASLERVQFGLKQFDMVLVFKDFTKTPLHINSIPSTQLDDVKNWLDSVDIPLAEGPVNLNWGPIMKTINDSPYDFFQHGGWSFLGGSAGGEDSAGSDESDTESEFEAEDEEVSESESSDESDAYSDASGSSASESGSYDDDSDGDDWDELERKAAKSDKKRAETGRGNDSDVSDDDRRKKKPAGKANGKSNGKAPVKRK
ncbi:FACT complex subunit SPT16 [Punctularia strigosozonata HHB-11173 SS5]|uniref:FACT complex subunit SPT16 n=1 Tax=Punctularia strigosozonata (strain HHB-11173) TaxID=741275 RepID=UPI0004417DE7|nr:FACT complex subunit SPT16 [Punctularia strigosozonata HHB-11173 SS5]EIN07653.1 FACT complex subunit SPT16 [Punctularia strigosozonata HHB-11173 SS5]